eukprot:scaffold2111_cov36-Phaeocystis_antarctica.AAC.2
MSAQARLGSYSAALFGATAWILRLCTPIRVAARGYRARAMLGLHAPMALKESAGASTPSTARGRSWYDWMEREVAVSSIPGPLAGSASVARLASWGERLSA